MGLSREATTAVSVSFFDGELLPASVATFLDLAGLVLLLRALRHPCRRTFLAAASNSVGLNAPSSGPGAWRRWRRMAGVDI